MDALLPSPAPMGMVERRVYKQPGKVCDPNDKKMYKKADAEFWWTFLISSGASRETLAKCGFMAATRSGSSSVMRS